MPTSLFRLSDLAYTTPALPSIRVLQVSQREETPHPKLHAPQTALPKTLSWGKGTSTPIRSHSRLTFRSDQKHHVQSRTPAAARNRRIASGIYAKDLSNARSFLMSPRCFGVLSKCTDLALLHQAQGCRHRFYQVSLEMVLVQCKQSWWCR